MTASFRMRAAVGLLVAATAALPLAAEPPQLGEGRGEVTLSWDEFVKITGYDPARKGAQVVTIPWKEVESLLGVKVERVGDAATVDLPWQDFKALLQWSIDREGKGKEAAPPTDYVVVSSAYEGTLTPEGAAFTLRLKLDLLREEGWKRIPVLPGGVAIVEVRLPDDRKAWLNPAQGVYELLTAEGGEISLEIDFRVAVRSTAGIHRVEFPRITGGSSVVDLVVPHADADVTVASAQSQTGRSGEGETRVAATLAGGEPLAVTWERALPKVEAGPPKLYAESQTLVGVGDGLLICQESIRYSILHSPVRELKLTVPDGVSVLTVAGRDVQDWRVAEGELTVVLAREVLGAYELNVSYEQAAGDTPAAPVLRTLETHRERGFVGVVAMANVEISAADVSGATEIDPRGLPGELTAMTSQPLLLAFRHVGGEFDIPLMVKRHAQVPVLVTICDGALYTIMQLDDGRRMTRAAYTVRNNRNQFLRVTMPEGAEVWSAVVDGKTVSPALDEEGHVLVPLVRSAAGASTLSSFPVEVAYVETPDEEAPAEGKLRVDLPTLDAPALHVMCNYYAPAKGNYMVRAGLFGSRSGFSGPLVVVEHFAAMQAGQAGPPAPPMDVNVEVMQMQMDQQMAQRARSTGAAPIRVELPLNGKLFKLEKILALPDDELYFEVRYSGWKSEE